MWHSPAGLELEASSSARRPSSKDYANDSAAACWPACRSRSSTTPRPTCGPRRSRKVASPKCCAVVPRVREASFVQWPAYPDARVSCVRNRTAAQLESDRILAESRRAQRPRRGDGGRSGDAGGRDRRVRRLGDRRHAERMARINGTAPKPAPAPAVVDSVADVWSTLPPAPRKPEQPVSDEEWFTYCVAVDRWRAEADRLPRPAALVRADSRVVIEPRSSPAWMADALLGIPARQLLRRARPSLTGQGGLLEVCGQGRVLGLRACCRGDAGRVGWHVRGRAQATARRYPYRRCGRRVDRRRRPAA